MGTVNQMMNTTLAAGGKTRPEKAGYGEVNVAIQTFEVAAADDDGSVYGLFFLPANAVPLEITVMCDAITGGTDWDLGLYLKGSAPGTLGAVIDKDVLMDGQTLASASKVLDGMGIVDKANYGMTLAELLGAASNNFNGAAYSNINTPPEFALALTANTVGSGAGTVTVICKFAVNG